MGRDHLQEIIDQYQEDKQKAREDLYKKLAEKIGKEYESPKEIKEIDRTGDEEKETLKNYKNIFKPKTRDMIETIHGITYNVGKIIDGEGDEEDLQTVKWFLEQSENMDRSDYVQTGKQKYIYIALEKVIESSPSLGELADYATDNKNAKIGRDYLKDF